MTLADPAHLVARTKDLLSDRDLAEKHLRAADRPLDDGVYQLFHEWWPEAPQRSIDDYRRELLAIDGAEEFIAARYLPEPTTVADLENCPPDSLGDHYRRFVVEHGLMENLARDYREFHDGLQASGKLDRLPDEMACMIVRGFQIHDVLHVIAGNPPSPMGELAQAAFHFAQLQYPYHAMRMAATAHMAFVRPTIIVEAMDAIVAGWSAGRASSNLHFVRREEQFDTPVQDIRDRFGVPVTGATV